MNEQAYRKTDLALKIVTAVVVVAGGIIGFWKYLDTAEKEFRKPYWEKQVSLYFDATSAAAILATTEDEATRRAAEATFWKLYWGPLALVEDRQVEAAMVRIRNCLIRPDCSRAELEQLSLSLAHTCRESLGQSWDLKLEELTGRE